MNMIDRAVAVVSPRLARVRLQERYALQQIAMRYEAATTGNRGKSWRPVGNDADGAAKSRARLAFISRDLIRNNAYAVRAQQVIANNVVGDGIIPKVSGRSSRAKAAMQRAIRTHLDGVGIDADGRLNLYGLQRLAMNAVVADGEVLLRRRRRAMSDGLALPFQVQVLEIDYLCTTRDGSLANGNLIRDGIEYDQIGRRVAYWLHDEHPGAQGWRLKSGNVRRVAASEVIHLYRVDRPGQARGVSWLAPVALRMQDLADYNDAQLMRQKIAACFAAFITSPEADPTDTNSAGLGGSIVPGRIQRLAPGEEVRFATPPAVQAYDEFTRGQLREIAAGLGVTYEALTGDLSNVNFSSGRMGRMEMDRNVSAWQWLMMVPGMLHPLGAWILEAFALVYGRSDLTLDWVPPHRILIDPAREIKAMADEVKAGLSSRSQKIRQLGYDPEEVTAEIEADQRDAERRKLVFDTDVGGKRQAPPAAAQPRRPASEDDPEDDPEDDKEPDDGEE